MMRFIDTHTAIRRLGIKSHYDNDVIIVEAVDELFRRLKFEEITKNMHFWFRNEYFLGAICWLEILTKEKLS